MKELDPTSSMGDFFDFLWGEQSGYVYLATKDRALDEKDPKAFRKTIHKWPLAKEKVIATALANSADGLDVYMCPAVFDESIMEDRKVAKKHVKGSYVIWADFDGNAPPSWDALSGAQEGPNGAFVADLAAIPPPTVRIKSSITGHEHCYWRFDNFETDTEAIETLNRGIAYKYGADKGGWDITQVLRPIGTTNHKRHQSVVFEAGTDKSYNLDTFKALRDYKQVVFDAIQIKDVPPLTHVLLKYPFTDQYRDLFLDTNIEEGKRSSALMSLGYFGAESGMEDMEIYALLDDADKRWGKFTGRHNRDWYLLDIIGKARKKHPVGGEEGLFRGLIGATEAEEAPEFAIGLSDFNAKEYNFEWIVEGLLERQGMALLASAPGLGKTQMSLDFGMCAALGRKWLAWDIPKPMKILFYSLEMNGPSLQQFTQSMAAGYTDEEKVILNENFIILPEYHYLPLDRDEGKAALEDMIKKYEPDGIIFDSMGKLTGESLSDEKKAKQLNNYYSAIRRGYDLFIWFVHHNRKANGDNKQPKELQDIYGNQYITADVTSALSLWNGDDGLELNMIKTRLSKQQNTLKVFRSEDSLRFYLSEDAQTFDGLTKERSGDPDAPPSSKFGM